MPSVNSTHTLLQARISELVNTHGSYRRAAKAVKVEHSYLHRLFMGTESTPSAKTAAKLGLRRVVSYERLLKEPQS